ncbi:hypothetical protein LguiA_013587 [Lonicera macranthoides]
MTNIEFSYKSNFCGTTMGGEARKLVRFKALAKDFYVGEFVGDQWAVLKRPATEVLGTKTDLSVVGCVDRVDDRDLNVEGLQETIAGLRKENDNLPLIIRPWSVEATLEREDKTEVLVWIQLPNLKLHLWSQAMLSRIASVIRRPLFSNRMTAEKKMLAYARVCFEIKVNTNLPDNVLLLDEEGNQVIQKVEYEWILMACKVCEVFGHTYANCPKKTNVS